MKQGQYLNPIYQLSLRDVDSVPRRISYSQWAMYEKCPRSWKLAYIDGLAPFQASIETVFGTAFHETFQHYLTVMYTDSVKRADALDLRDILTNKLREEYAKCVGEMNNQHFSTALEMAEYLEDGAAILEWIKKRRKQYFSTKEYELVGIEVELCTPATEKNPSVYLFGFVDLIIRHVPTNTFYVYDIKTSRNGWNKYQKTDPLKAAQLVLYKNKFSEQFGVPRENIIVEFFIVKRKLIEESMFPQKRVQLVRPSSGTVTQRKVQKQIDEFVSTAFDETGNKNTDHNYVAVAGKGEKNCRYCPFKTDYENCPRESRIRQ